MRTPIESRCRFRGRTMPSQPKRRRHLIPARNIPLIPHFPRGRPQARSIWGKRGKGGKISPLTRWSRPILREASLAGAGGYERSPGSERGSRVGIHLEVDGDDLLLEAPAPPPSAILE